MIALQSDQRLAGAAVDCGSRQPSRVENPSLPAHVRST